MAPPKRDTEPVLLRLHRRTLDAIQEVIDQDPELTSRQEVIRRALEDWFTARGVKIREPGRP